VTPIALLSGGDYDTKGVPSYGPRKALRAVQEGLAESLISQSINYNWKIQMAEFFMRKGISVSPSFPNERASKYYCHPTVFS
jgi:holliday junction resolvase GEN1/YEN1